MKPESSVEDVVRFPVLEKFPWLVHGFTSRLAGVPVDAEKTEVLALLRDRHTEILSSCGIEMKQLRLAEQVHGNRVAVVDGVASHASSDVDGLVTAKPGVPLGIFVADCCAVFLVETGRRAIGLLHSGRKGTEGNIVREGTGQDLKSALERHRVTADDAINLFHQHIPVGHTVHILRGRRK